MRILSVTQLKIVSRSTVAIALVIGLLNLSMPERVRATPLLSAPNELKLRSTTQVRTEAGWYDTAMREISRISAMKLSNAEELAQANAIVDKNVSNLRYNRSKLVLIGLSDSTFINAVRAKAGDSKSAEKFAIGLAENPTSIFQISGGISLSDRIRRSLEADVAKIKSVAVQIKRAASDLEAKTKTHHSFRALTKTNSFLKNKNAEPFQPQAIVTGEDIATIAVVVAVLAYPPLGLALFTIANFALPGYGGVGLTAVVVLGAASLIDRLISNLGTEEGKDKVAACQQETDAKYRRCIRSAAGLGIFRIPAEAACYADWLLGSAACLVTY